MGGSQAAKVLVQIQESTLKKQGKEITTEEHNALVENHSNYTKQTKSRIFCS